MVSRYSLNFSLSNSSSKPCSSFSVISFTASALVFSPTFYLFQRFIFYPLLLTLTYSLRNLESLSHGLKVDMFSTSYLESLSMPFKNQRITLFVPCNRIFNTGIISFQKISHNTEKNTL